MFKIKKWGPFTIYRCKVKKERKNFVDISLTRYSDASWGWEWGSDGNEPHMANIIKLFNFNIFGFDRCKKGFEIRFFGFWWIC